MSWGQYNTSTLVYKLLQINLYIFFRSNQFSQVNFLIRPESANWNKIVPLLWFYSGSALARPKTAKEMQNPLYQADV